MKFSAYAEESEIAQLYFRVGKPSKQQKNQAVKAWYLWRAAGLERDRCLRQIKGTRQGRK